MYPGIRTKRPAPHDARAVPPDQRDVMVAGIPPIHRGDTPSIYVQWVAPQARFFSGFCRTSTFFFFFFEVSHVILGALVQLFSGHPEMPLSLTSIFSGVPPL